MDAIETLKAENDRSGGPLEGSMDLERFGVMGWSMGGGGTLIAARDNPTELKAAVALCGWENGRFGTNKVPHLLFGGENDGTAAPRRHAIPHYESIPAGTPKMYFEVRGGGHSVANNPANGMGQVGRYGLSWMKVFLEDDDRYMQFLENDMPSAASDFRSEL
jgi:dienelactone hydrolase